MYQNTQILSNHVVGMIMVRSPIKRNVDAVMAIKTHGSVFDQSMYLCVYFVTF